VRENKPRRRRREGKNCNLVHIKELYKRLNASKKNSMKNACCLCQSPITLLNSIALSLKPFTFSSIQLSLLTHSQKDNKNAFHEQQGKENAPKYLTTLKGIGKPSKSPTIWPVIIYMYIQSILPAQLAFLLEIILIHLYTLYSTENICYYKCVDWELMRNKLNSLGSSSSLHMLQDNYSHVAPKAISILCVLNVQLVSLHVKFEILQ